MSLLDTLQSALAGPVKGIVDQFAHKVEVRREYSFGQTESGRELMQWGTPTGYDSVSVVIEVITQEQARRLWGNETKAVARGTVSTLDYSPKFEDGLIVIKGPFATRRYIVKETIPVPEAKMVIMGLEETEDTFSDA